MTDAESVRVFRARHAEHLLAPEIVEAPARPEWIPVQLWYLSQKLMVTSCLIDAVEAEHDLSHIVDHFLYWLLSEELKQHAICAPVADLYRRRLAGDEPSKKEWKAVRVAAAAAVPTTAALVAEEAAMGSAVRASEQAARTVAAVREAAYDRMQEKLLELLA